MVVFTSDNQAAQLEVWKEARLRRPHARKGDPWRVGDTAEKMYTKWEPGVVETVDADITVLFDVDNVEDVWVHTSASLRHA